MWKKIGLVILGLVIGGVLGSVGTMAYCGYSLAKCMFMLQEKEILRIGERAEEAYHNQPNEVAAWALTSYIETLKELKEERSVAESENPYLLLTPDRDLVFAHGRVGQLYKEMDNAEKSRYHFKEALSYCSSNGPKFIKTEADLMNYINKLDEMQDVTE